MADIHIFRIDHHGSLIRPPELIVAREQHAAGALDLAGLRAVEDQAIRDVLLLQRKLRVTQVTDGQFRRGRVRDAAMLAAGRAGIVPEEPTTAVSFVEEAAFVMGETDWAVKQQLPSPAHLARQLWTEDSAHASPVALGHALAEVWREELRAMLDAGVRLVQFNNPDYAAYYAGDAKEVGGIGVLDAIAIDSAVLDGIERPEDARIAMCVDQGDHQGEVDEQVAWEVLGELPYDRFMFAYCTDALVEQQLLQFVPEGKAAVLGIVDPLVAELEDIDAIMTRMDAAFELKGLDELAISPSRGFQHAVGAPTLTLDEQKHKVTHVETVARMCWGNEL